MENSEIVNLYRQAEAELSRAERELERPMEDVVVLTVCANARHAIRKILTAFLASKAEEQGEEFILKDKLDQLGNMPIEQLLKECRLRQKAFTGIDTSALECCQGPASEFNGYCLEVNRVSSCTSLGRELEKTVRKHSNLI